ncbi:MAG: hypothetical protein WCV99_07035 [Sterolibacterium sp.]|jgi:hypothetical protein
MPETVPSADPRLRQENSGQRGFALLVMLIIAVMGSLFAVTGQLEFVSRKYARDEGNLKSLTLAKEALLGYALTYRDSNNSDVFGYLPCPSTYVGTNQDMWGAADSSCAAGAIGLLPYKTLGLPDLRDAEGNCLWYAVAGSFKNSAPVPQLNWDTQGQFTIAGTSVAPNQGDGGGAAVIIAPGAALTAQAISSTNGPCAVDPAGQNYLSYLESYDSATNTFTPGTHSGSNNDIILWITPKEIFDKVVKRADFSNLLASTPKGQINQLTDEIKAALEKEIQDDVVAAAISSSQPRNTGSYTQFSGKQVGDLQDTLTLSTAYANYYSNWIEQYRQVTCSPLTACLTIAGTACRGALMFGGRTAKYQNGVCAVTQGQPRLTAQKTSGTANLGYYFESPTTSPSPCAPTPPTTSGGGLDLLNGSTFSFSGNTSYTAASPSADVGICLFPGVIDSFAQDIASFTRIVTSAGVPEAAINVAAQTVTLGNPAATTSGRGCVWYPTQLPFNYLLRAYFKMRISNLGEGFIFAVVDGPANQAGITAGTICGTTTGALMGYSSSNVDPPKFGLEIDTRLTTTSDCSGSNRNDPSSHHMAFVYWGSTSTTSDDNCHGSTAGTLGSGSQPLNPRTPLASATTPTSTVGTSVSSAAWSGNVVVIATTAAHGRSSGQQVTVSGVTPSGYNGTYAISVIDTSHFAYSLASNPGTYASGGTVKINAGIKNVQSSDTSLPYSGSLPLNTNFYVRLDAAKTYDATLIQAASAVTTYSVMITTGSAHGFVSGQTVNISGISPGTYNGSYTITVLTSTQFTYVLAGDPGAYVSGGTIGGIAVTSATPYYYQATITTAAAHGLVSNQRVTISGSGGYNGTYTINVTDSTHFTYALGADPGSYVSGGSITAPTGITVSSASRAAAGSAWAATITTAAAHGYVSGQPVTIAGVSPGAYNGTYQIVVVDATHFTYALGADPGAYVSGGSLTAAVALTLKAYVASNFPDCTLTDFQNLSRDLGDLCSQNPTIQQDNVYLNDTANGKALATIFAGFTNAQGSGSSSEQTVTISDFLIRTQ